ncbi:ABC transporter ATP-binding protein [Thermodesulfobacteriota bacterium]
MDEAYLQIKSLNLSLGKFSLRDINLSCGKGEYHALLGPTGSGKSSLMKCLLGLYRIDKGSIYLRDKDISEELPENRCMGYVPQSYSLFPHLDVEGNIRFGLQVRKNSSRDTGLIVDRLCNILNIQKLRKRDVGNLSGGEKQKVALARALAIEPDIILFDEPFSSIDEGAKRNLWIELKEIIKEIGITAFHITHNLEEAYTMGERLSVLINGELLQSGSKNKIFENPLTESVARYLNYRNIFSGITQKHGKGTNVKTDHFNLCIHENISEGNRVKLCIRQQDIKIIKKGRPLKDSLQRNVFSGKIVSLFPLPEDCLVCFKIEGSPQKYDFEIKFPRYLMKKHNLYKGKKIQVALWEPSIILLRK